MNGYDFVKEISTNVLAIKYMGDARFNFGATYEIYSNCEERMLQFLKRNTLNIVSCLDVYGYNSMWTSTEDVCRDMISLFDAGEYDEFLLILTKNNTIDTIEHKLKKIQIKVYWCLWLDSAI